jgi:ABC-type transport system substrate-binding protein
MGRARQLVAASDTRGAAVTVWSPAIARPAVSEIVRALNELGYRATPKILPNGAFFGHRNAHSSSIQIGFYGWIPNFPAPSDFMLPLFSCASIPPPVTDPNVSYFCDPSIERQMRRASAIQVADPAAANDAWGEVDHAIVDASPWLAYANPHDVYFVSERVGNIQINPQWKLLLDQLWVN